MSFRKPLSIKKRSLANPNYISISDWLKHAPYHVAINGYDQQFLPLCNHVLSLVNKYTELLDFVSMKNSLKKRLAISLVAYFEDYMLEIGIWKAFIETNKELYGYYLPFYDLTNYQPDDFNVEDLAYIIFHFASKSNEDKVLSPEKDVLELATEVFNYLEPMLELDNMKTTNFYDKYLVVKGDDDFFNVKERLLWMATSSYLLGAELQLDIQQEEKNLKEHIENDPRIIEYAGMFLYQVADDIMYGKRSSFSALNTTEWFSKIVRSDDKTKEMIEKLQYRHSGSYLYTADADRHHFLYINVETKREYSVYKDSVKNKHKNIKPNTTIFHTHLIFWNDKWWQTGIATAEPKEGYTKPMIPTNEVPWTYSEEHLKRVEEMLQEMYDDFVTYFGSPLYIAKDIEDLVQKNVDSIRFSREKKGGDKKDSPMESLKGIAQQRAMLMESLGKNAKGIGSFFVKGEGITMLPELDEIIAQMKAKSLPLEAQKQLYYELIANINPHLATYLTANFPLHNIIYPVISGQASPSNTIAWMTYWWRFHHPEQFGIKIPNITVLPDEQADKLKK